MIGNLTLCFKEVFIEYSGAFYLTEQNLRAKETKLFCYVGGISRWYDMKRAAFITELVCISMNSYLGYELAYNTGLGCNLKNKKNLCLSS